jgi:hypothetical membrane protein
MPGSSRIAALIGWFGVAIFATCSVVAAMAYSGATGEAYSPLNHYVSELGARTTGGLGPLFNAGIVIGALCLLVFLVEVGRRIGGRRGTLIGALGVIAGIGGTLVGIFPIDDKGVHTLVASTYFVSLAGAVALATLWMGGPRLPRTALATALGIATAATSAGYFLIYSLEGPGPGGASDPNAPRPAFALDTTVEWAALISVMAWVAVVAAIVWVTEGRTTQAPAVTASAAGGVGE